MKKLFDWIDRNERPIEEALGILFFAVIFVVGAAAVAAMLVGY